MFVCLFVCLYFFSVKDFSATTWLRTLKFDTKLDREELYYVTKTATYYLSVPLFVHFSFFPMKILTFSVKDFSATTWLRILKFYCVTKNIHVLLISPFICSLFFLSNENFNFFSVQDFSASTWLRILKFRTKLDSDELSMKLVTFFSVKDFWATT